MDERDEIGRILQQAARLRRPYAGFFDWPDRAVGEWGIAKAFSDAARGERGVPFKKLKSRAAGDDPPDCEAIDADGLRLGIEVTELVDGSAIKAALRRGGPTWAEWDRAKLLTRLQTLLVSKDGKVLRGGPYDEYVVIIHTDEPVLVADSVDEWLRGVEFESPKQLARAYLLLSYDPSRNGYPYFRLH